ncbi:MAG: Tol-Pal system beta propeller repeat protein TolB [Candidatus Abyssubacteria bacterium]|nr:Tol-Pal system beta propeller repeat protein TolB [Candidatus Abyssubacteria bacterium]
MIRRLYLAVLPVVILFACAGALFGQSDIIIDIYEPGTAKIKMGVPPFVKGSASSSLSLRAFGEEVAAVLRNDLAFTGLFEVYDSLPGRANAGATEFAPLKEWIPTGVQSVVQGRYKWEGDKIRLECALFDVESETRIAGKYYTGTLRAMRRNAHRFADEIVYRYTGKRGIAHTKIAYVNQKAGRKEIYIMDYDGYNSYRLTYENSITLSPDWSPDGKKMIFTSYRDRNPDVYMVDLEEKKYTRISGYIGLNIAPAFSPGGETLALTLSKSGNPELYLLDLKSGDLTRLTRNSRVDTSPTWSPNGREIAFVSDRSGYPQIYIIDREGVNLRRLTYSGYNNTSPAWSPQGDKIAYVSMAKGMAEIHAIHPTGTALQRLTFNSGNEDPCWSPCGRYLAYSSGQKGQRDVYLMRADGSGKRRITFGGGENMAPAWSPMGH